MKISRSKVMIGVILSLLLTFALLPAVAFAQDALTPTPGDPASPTPTVTATAVPPTVTATPVPPTATSTPIIDPPAPVPIPEPVTVILFGTGLAALSAAVATRRNNKDS